MSLAVCSNVAAAFVVWLDYTLDRDQRVPAKGGQPRWTRHKWLKNQAFLAQVLAPIEY
jgi:hypothetical protein